MHYDPTQPTGLKAYPKPRELSVARSGTRPCLLQYDNLACCFLQMVWLLQASRGVMVRRASLDTPCWLPHTDSCWQWLAEQTVQNDVAARKQKSCCCILSSIKLQAPCVLYIGQAFRYSPDNAFYIFNQQIYFIIWYLLDRASLM